MSEEDDLVEIPETDEASELQIHEAKQKLEERCRGTRIEIRENELTGRGNYLSIGFPNGRRKRWVALVGPTPITQMLSTPFESYCFVGDLEAICSYDDGVIEAVVRPLSPFHPSIIRRTLLPADDVDAGEERGNRYGRLTVTSTEDEGKITLTLGPASSQLAILTTPYATRGLSLTLSGLQIDNHDDALAILKKLSNSFFFQIDATIGVALVLAQSRRNRMIRHGHRSGQSKNLQFPKTEYDEAPLSLYWYARGAMGMPLLQFLAYYQVVEFYFHSYSSEEARRKIQHILKDPTFRLDRDADIARVLTAVDSRGRGYGDEKSQLRSTLAACVEADDLRTFIEEDEGRREFFSKKQKGLTTFKLALSNPNLDLRNDAADLLYDIRCRIVHTKGESAGSNAELLLPFSPESEMLGHNIELMQFLARRVLIAASSTLRM